MENPPRPQPGDPTPVPPTPVQSGTNAGMEQQPKVQPAKTDRTWTVQRTGGKCYVRTPFSCPTPKPGVAAPTCNPPPPKAYACTPEIAEGATVTIVLYANQTVCQIQPAPMTCPPNVMCNPPPPQKVACPQ
jgi:hypothetical protein